MLTSEVHLSSIVYSVVHFFIAVQQLQTQQLQTQQLVFFFTQKLEESWSSFTRRASMLTRTVRNGAKYWSLIWCQVKKVEMTIPSSWGSSLESRMCSIDRFFRALDGKACNAKSPQAKGWTFNMPYCKCTLPAFMGICPYSYMYHISYNRVVSLLLHWNWFL